MTSAGLGVKPRSLAANPSMSPSCCDVGVLRCAQSLRLPDASARLFHHTLVRHHWEIKVPRTVVVPDPVVVVVRVVVV
eukprot:s1884_g9.t1